MNLPNKITLIRIILIPIMVFLYLATFIPYGKIIALAVFILAACTDFLDGMIARKYGLVTNLGKFLDPIADKVLVISAMLILVEAGHLPAWIPIIIITRELAVSGYRLIAVEQKGEVVAANVWGKLKTVTQMIAIILAFIDVNNFGDIFIKHLGTIPFILNMLTTSLMIICVIATIFSGYEYLKNGKELLKDAK